MFWHSQFAKSTSGSPEFVADGVTVTVVVRVTKDVQLTGVITEV
jgi:hypothetical protein